MAAIEFLKWKILNIDIKCLVNQWCQFWICSAFYSSSAGIVFNRNHLLNSPEISQKQSFWDKEPKPTGSQNGFKNLLYKHKHHLSRIILNNCMWYTDANLLTYFWGVSNVDMHFLFEFMHKKLMDLYVHVPNNVATKSE